MPSIYYTDGFVKGKNPSYQGGGYTITDKDGNIIFQYHYYRNGEDKRFTNNDGEVLGIIHAIAIAEEGSIIVTDSKTAMWWVRKGKSKTRPDIDYSLLYAKNLALQKKIQIKWESRDINKAGQINEFGKVDDFIKPEIFN